MLVTTFEEGDDNVNKHPACKETNAQDNKYLTPKIEADYLNPEQIFK